MSLRSPGRQYAAAIRAGSREAFAQLYDLYAPRVAGFASRLLANSSDCDDIVQDVFVAAYAGRESFRGEAGALAWLLGITVRRCRDHGRKRTIDLADEDALDRASQIGARLRPVEDSAIRTIALADALSAIEPAFREALLLVASQGLTYAEAAIATGEPIGTVKWRVSAASAELRRALVEREEEADELPQTRV